METQTKLVNAFIIIVAVLVIVMPFVLNYPISGKVWHIALGIGLSASLIANRNVRYLVVSISLFVFLFAMFKWHLYQL